MKKGKLILMLLSTVAYNRITAILRRRQHEPAERAELTEATPDIVMKVSRDGRILYANRTVEQTLHRLGLPPQHYELLLPDDLETIVEDVLSGRARYGSVSWKMRERVIDYTVSAHGMGEAVLFRGVDVTDRTARKERLLPFLTMETWRKAVSGAAHDLHRLLTKTPGNAASPQGGRTVDPCIPDAITGVENAARGGLPFIRRLLAFGRKGSGEVRTGSSTPVQIKGKNGEKESIRREPDELPPGDQLLDEHQGGVSHDERQEKAQGGRKQSGQR